MSNSFFDFKDYATGVRAAVSEVNATTRVAALQLIQDATNRAAAEKQCDPDSPVVRERTSDALAQQYADISGLYVTDAIHAALDAFELYGRPHPFSCFVQGYFAVLIVTHPAYAEQSSMGYEAGAAA